MKGPSLEAVYVVIIGGKITEASCMTDAEQFQI
jgi:hypothetical protein